MQSERPAGAQTDRVAGDVGGYQVARGPWGVTPHDRSRPSAVSASCPGFEYCLFSVARNEPLAKAVMERPMTQRDGVIGALESLLWLSRIDLEPTSRQVRVEVAGSFTSPCRRADSAEPSPQGVEMINRWFLAIISLPLSALAGPVSLADFGPSARVISFDQLADGTRVGNQFQCSHGVLLGSTTQIGAESSADTADWQQPGQQISPFVVAIEAVPAQSTSSPPMKLIATRYAADGSLEQCERCGLEVRFLKPLPTKAGLWVTPGGADQTATFSGPGGHLATLVVPPPGGPFFVGYEDAEGIVAIVLRSAPTSGIGLDDLIAEGAPGPGCADQNADGAIDLVDSVILRRILAGEPVQGQP